MMTHTGGLGKPILITGAGGNLGGKLRDHLKSRGGYTLRLLDKNATTEGIIEADLSVWQDEWVDQFRGIDTVVHLAANPNASAAWEEITAPNLDALINVYAAATQTGVKRIVYASSNHAMGGYKHLPDPVNVTTDIPALPGAFYSFNGKEEHNSLAYGAAKYFGERIGKCYHDIYGLSTIAVRIGWNLHNDATPEPVRDDWFRMMWLSNRDYYHLMDCCIEADPSIGFAVVNGMSNNSGMRWDLSYTKTLIGYEPQDDITRKAVAKK